ncbi:MAG: hypothetical protein LBQ40_02705 [Clostridiales bacterium]|jgi:predicted DNA-binding protein|nr:hypothetical protein [Clostridiales bacterium]
MALKKDGERTIASLSIKKTTLNTLNELAKKENRPLGRMVDEIVERYLEAKNSEEKKR